MNDMHRFSKQWAWLALVLGLVGLVGMAGCSILGGGGAPPDRYTLNAPPATNHDTAGAVHFDASLDLRPVSAPDWLNSKRMLYRLEYANDNELAAYTRSAWADTPARLIGDNLDHALSSAHLFAAVLGQTAGQADLTLQLELDDFSQHFSSPRTSHGHIAVKATLLRTDNGQVIAQRHFTTTAPAATSNAAGGVRALATADTRLNTRLRRWLIQSIQACRPACTASTTD